MSVSGKPTPLNRPLKIDFDYVVVNGFILLVLGAVNYWLPRLP